MTMKNFRICPKLNYSTETKEKQESVDNVIAHIRGEMLAAGYAEANGKEKQIDWVFSIGGDGTMLHSMRSHLYKGSTVIGVNAGNVGFLTPYSLDDIFNSDIVSLLENNPRIEKRSILTHNLGDEKGYAVNDYAIKGINPNDMIDFSVEIEHRDLVSRAGHYRADALVLSGPCGSTAYNMNAGGSIIDPVVKCMQMVMVAPTTIGTRPLIISKNSKIHVKITSACKVFADGILLNELPKNNGTVVTVSLMLRESNILVPQDWNFFSVLAKKLHWNNGKDV
jgi:NAD+ kinase